MDMEDKNLTGGTPPENTPPVQEPVAVTPDPGAPEHDQGGKRLAASSGKKKKALIAATAVMALFLAGYLALCALGSENSPLPNTHVAGVSLSGATWEEATEKLSLQVENRLRALSVDFVCEGKVYSVPGTAFTPNTQEMVDQIRTAQQGGFLTRGGRYLSALLGASDRKVKLTLDTMPQEVLRAVEEWGDKDAVTDYTVTDAYVIFTKGRTGRTLDVAALLTALEEQAQKKLDGGEAETVTVAVTTMPPAEPNFEAIRREIFAEVSEAYYDPETGEIVPSVTGCDLDVEGARAMLEKTAEGAQCRVALILTQPQVSTESLTELLFRDVLGETTTYAYGTVSRRTNVRLSAEFANGQILMPGDEFSYANDCGPFTTDRGFMAAPGYLGGKTVDMEGGGVCQTASTIYYSVLRAGLEVVERHPHGYEPAYVPGGLDATVAGTVLDFRFANNTEYPVKIEATMDEKYNLTVRILGTNVTGTHWEPYSTNRVVTQYANVIYEPNENIPQGTTQKDGSRTAYNGVSIDSYNREIDAEGKVVQEIYLYRTRYKVRDAVIWYNPADAELWGIDPATGHLIEQPEDPNGAEDPNTTPGPEVSTEPQPGDDQPPVEPTPSIDPNGGEVPVLPGVDIPVPPTEPTPELTPEPTPVDPGTEVTPPPPAETPEQPVG